MASSITYRENTPKYWRDPVTHQKVWRFVQIDDVLYEDVALTPIGFDDGVEGVDWENISSHASTLGGNFREAVVAGNYELQKGTDFNGTIGVDYEILITE